MENIIVIHVSYLADGGADDLADVQGGVERGSLQAGDCDLAADNDDVAFDKGLAGDTAGAVERETGIKDRIGNGVANFVGMAFANGFGGKNITA